MTTEFGTWLSCEWLLIEVILDAGSNPASSTKYEEVDKNRGFKEILNSPVFRNFVISEDGKTTGIIVNVKKDEILNQGLLEYEGKSGEVKEVSESKVEGAKESGEVKEVSESKVEGVKEGDTENVKADTSKNTEIVKNIETPIEEESDDPIIEYVPTAMSGSNNEPQVMGGSSNPPPTGGGSPSIVFFPSKNFDTISDQTAKSLMNIVDG